MLNAGKEEGPVGEVVFGGGSRKKVRERGKVGEK